MGLPAEPGAHALDRIAYYLRREAMDASDVLEERASVERQLERLRERADEIAVPVRKVAESRPLFLLTAAHAAAQAHIRPHVLQGYLPLPHQGRTLATDYLNLDAPDREGAAFN